jgi:asparagine synthase (glutamine-hydrolysing)
MTNEDGTLWLTFNGEIFNHAELRAHLLADGHRFISQTDTESILHGYEALGQEVLGRLNGMFAFALWDSRQQSLWLVRDRLGVKPLFYGVFGQTLLFGSEIKALLAHPACPRRLDPIALDFYLSLNYIPAPYTLFEGIHQVQPSEWVLARVGSNTLEKQLYWHIPYGQPLLFSLPQAEEEFRARLGEAVRKRLMADVPLGAFLSGGLDSSAVVAFMRDYAQERVKTFSIGFAERSFDEAPFARLVAEHLGTDHHEQNITPQVAEILPRLVWHAEDPLADSSMLPVYYLSQMTRQHVTVALAGDGADEILAGYPTYQASLAVRRYSAWPRRPLAAILRALVRILPPSEDKISRREKLARLAEGLALDWRHAHAVWRYIHTPAQKSALLGRPSDHQRLFEAYSAHYEACADPDPLAQLLYADTRFYLPSDMLAKVDRMSMAHGLEARTPFLDYELVEFVARLPSDFKLRGGVGKFILRRIMAERLPQTTLTRPKAGFNVPVSAWLRRDLAPLLCDTLAEGRVRQAGILQAEAVSRMVDDHLARRADYGYPLWGLLTLMLWWGQFMEGKS